MSRLFERLGLRRTSQFPEKEKLPGEVFRLAKEVISSRWLLPVGEEEESELRKRVERYVETWGGPEAFSILVEDEDMREVIAEAFGWESGVLAKVADEEFPSVSELKVAETFARDESLEKLPTTTFRRLVSDYLSAHQQGEAKQREEAKRKLRGCVKGIIFGHRFGARG